MRAEARGREHCAAQVESAPPRLGGVGRDDLQGGDGERDGDGEVDEEDHPPVGELGEEAADENADRGAGTADCAPGSERLRLRGPWKREVMIDSAAGESMRRAEALTGPRREQGRCGAGERRGERGRR